MRILFLTTLNLATNPRLVKEIRLAISVGFRVELICFEFENWSKELNNRLKAEFAEVTTICIPAGRRSFLPWFSSVISEKFHRQSAHFFSANDVGISKAISRRTGLLLKAINKVSKPDLVIGHNPGALYPTFYAAQKFNCRSGFDVEDYHPGESDDTHLQSLAKKLMQNILPKMDYVSFASPLIRNEVKKDLVSEGKNWLTVLNYFHASEFIAPASTDGPVKLVWFSQNVAAGRGLELILPTLKIPGDKVELHLFGQMNQDFHETALKGCNNIYIHEPLPQTELHKKLSEFDIGLALEPGKDFNNELAISNKILAYFQAGLFILASDTKAQKEFIDCHPLNGISIALSSREISESLSELIRIKDSIRIGADDRFEKAKKISWEQEEKKLLGCWRKTDTA